MNYKFCINYLILFLAFSEILYAQTKKEQIVILMQERDSIFNLLKSSNNSYDVLNDKYTKLNKRYEELISKNNDEISQLTTQVNKLNKTLDSLKLVSQPGRINLDKIANIKNFYKTFKSTSGNKYTLNIIKDSVGNHDFFVPKTIEFTLNDSTLSYNLDSNKNMIADGWGGLFFIDEHTISLSINCDNIILNETSDSLTWNRKFIYRKDYYRECNSCPTQKDDQGKPYEVLQDYSFIYFTNPDLFFLNNITNNETKELSSELIEKEWGWNNIIGYKSNILCISTYYDSETYDGGYIAYPETNYSIYDLKHPKEIMLYDIFPNNNINRLNLIIKNELTKLNFELKSFEVNQNYDFAIKNSSIIFTLFTRWETSFGDDFTQIKIPFSKIKHLMYDNELTRRILND